MMWTARALATLAWLLLGHSLQAQQPAGYETMLQELIPQAPAIRCEALQQQLGTAQAPILLDARGKQEYLVSHLPGAQWIGIASFSAARVAHLPKDQPLVVYCSVGYRSGLITQQLQELGFTRVHNLWGGLFAWANLGLRLQAPDGRQTQAAHPYNETWGQWLIGATHAYR